MGRAPDVLAGDVRRSNSVPALVKAKPELAKVAPYSTVLEILKGDRAAIAKLTMPDLEKLVAAT